MRTRSSPTLEKWTILVTVCSYVSTAFSGIMRYVFGGSGAAVLIYGASVCMAFTILIYVWVAVRTGVISKVLFFTLMVLTTSSMFGFLFVGNIGQVLFGLYTMIEFTFGVVALKVLRGRVNIFRIPMVLLWILVVIGVILNIHYEFPWSGYAYGLVGHQIQASRDWTTYGIQRIAGFGRTSIDTAHEILILSIFIVVFSSHKITKIIVWLITGFALYYTTTKTELGAYLVLTLLFMARLFTKKIEGRMLVLLGILIGITLPAYSVISHVSYNLTNVNAKFYFGSLVVRISSTWPSALEFVSSFGNAWLGRGMGGIGPAQKYFESNMYNPGDNMYVFGYANFGVLFLLIIICCLLNLGKLKPREDKFDDYIITVAVALAWSGITTNVIVEPSFALSLGSAVNVLLSRRELKRSPDPSHFNTPELQLLGNRGKIERYGYGRASIVKGELI